MDEYNVTARKLNSELEALKQQKSTIKSQIVRTLKPSNASFILTCGFLGDPPLQNNLRGIIP